MNKQDPDTVSLDDVLTKIPLDENWFHEIGTQVLEDFEEAKAAGHVGQYDRDMEDRDTPGLVWNMFGCWHNEVDKLYVIAKYKGATWAIRSKPGLIFPRMIDRCFGLDQRDRPVVDGMSNTLHFFIKRDVLDKE